MSRLDSVIRRLKAQRACLDWAVDRLCAEGLLGTAGENGSGVVLELGLGNGRTYDHLREKLGGDRDIHVFEREVRAHPACIPPDDRLFLGDVTEALPRAAAALGPCAVLVHCDIGTGDKDANRALAAKVSALLPPLLAPGAITVSDQELDFPGLEPLPLPDGVPEGRYHLKRFAG